jgi:integrase/recombinase XerD
LDHRDLFLAHVAIEKGLAKNTIEAYRRDLDFFYNFLQNRELVVSSETVGEFLSKHSGAKSSRDRTLSTLKSYFKFLLGEGLIDNDPTSTFHSTNREIRLPKALSLAQVNSLISFCSVETPQGIRDQLLLELLYGTGMRISEAVGLDLDDFDLTNGWIKIRFAKGSKQRIVPVGSKLKSALDSYLVRARPDFLKSNNRESALLLSLRGTRLTRQAAWQIIKKIGQNGELNIDLSPHSLRHTFATHLLAGGADIRVVQELLGHSVVTTTQIYTKVNIDQVRDTFIFAHPRAR